VASRLQTLSPEQQAAVEALTRGLVNKFLHQPVQAIKAAATEGNVVAVDAIREAFGVSGQRLSAAEEDIFDDFPELEDQERKS
jgi:glutamyl-tRNA reductase